MEDVELSALVREARQLYEANAGRRWLVAPAAPVLFFGNLPGFRESTPRVATVALNPSRAEFPPEAPFLRFPAAGSPEESSYLSSLFAYFQTAPYRSWFGFYEQALLGMGSSYYGDSDAVALHTDIGSVLATDPTLSRAFAKRTTAVSLFRINVRLGGQHKCHLVRRPYQVMTSRAPRGIAASEDPPCPCIS